VDEDASPAADEREASRPPPDEPTVSGALSDEMVGLPEQRPGYPGQQRSVDTG
jgi:hypothetical protein